MTRLFLYIILIVYLLLQNISSFAQADKIMAKCEGCLSSDFISNGQEYKVTLKDENKINFYVTFSQGLTYRISTCTNLTNGRLHFSVYDIENNLQFSSKGKNVSYYDFKFESNSECRIELDADFSVYKGGIVMMLIGYKKGK
jgi:hypothetical protein